MTIDTLFGQGKSQRKDNALRLKVIRPVYELVKVSEEVAQYLDASTPLCSSSCVAALFAFLAKETKEHFLALHLSSKNQLLCLELVSIGSLSAAVVHPREVFKSALLSSAAALILLHNHPSGDIVPSSEDREITRRLQEAGDLLGIRILDHLIIGDAQYFSFADSAEL